MQNIKEISDTLRGPKVNARRHWDGENWILEDAKTRKPLLIGTRAQILDESIKPRDTPTPVRKNARGSITVPDHRHDPSPSQRLCVAFYAIFQETDSLPSAFHPKTFYVLL